MKLSPAALGRATLARQMLLSRQEVSVTDAIDRLAGMQAQEAKPPFLGLWSRILGFRRDDLAGALRVRTVIRATSMRGTLHLMTKKDYVRLRSAIQPALDRGLKSVLRDRLASIDLDAVLEEAKAWFAKDTHTFDDLRDHLASKWPKADIRAMAYATRLKLPLVQVPTDAPWAFPGAADFALADWAFAPLDMEALVTRYLGAFGPASVADMQSWSGLDKLQPTFDAMRAKLVTFETDKKRELFDLPKAPRPDEDVEAPPRFLPEFDNLVLAHADRTRFIQDLHRGKVVTKNLRVRATFLVDGRVQGTWKIERKKTTARVTLEPFEKLTKAARASLEPEALAAARFYEPDANKYEVR